MDRTVLKVITFVILSAKYSLCTVDGISYMDPLNFKPLPETPGSNPCNPLYWYPKNIPEYCYMSNTPKPLRNADPIPMPIPVPMPQPVPIPVPAPPVGQPAIAVSPVQAAVPLPYGLPIIPSNPMLPFSGVYPQVSPAYFPYSPTYPSSFGSYPYPQQQMGMVPGVPGLVSSDGGINILPFSDAYSDIIETHKNKMLRKRLHKVIEDYEDYPRSFRRYRKYRRRISV